MELQNYEGSRLLEGLNSYISLELDQLNFVVSQLASLLFASLYRTILGPTKVSTNVRHWFGLVLGLWTAYFCFGYQAVHIAVLPALCYLVIATQQASIVHAAVLFTAMLYLSLVHIYRLLEDSTRGLDITGPLMIITQKVSSLAFSLHDGMGRHERELTKMQKQYAVRAVPSFLEFFSFSLMFPSLMAGPAVFYNDYIEFIEGDSQKRPEPNPTKIVIQKSIKAVICAFVFIVFLPKFPINRIKEDEFVKNNTFSYKILYLTVSTTLFRTKYYFAWTLADAICNNAGMGWTGSSWDRYTNVDILQFEFATSLKVSIDAWNKGTNKWLRFIVYERVKKHPVLITYTLSALWHGFFAGYYLTFLSGAVFTFAARTIRNHIRPHFMSSTESKLLYDVLTFSITRFTLAYLSFPFMLLEFNGSVQTYNNLYWVLHILAILAIQFVPELFPKTNNVERKKHKNGIALAISRGGSYTEVVGKID